MVRISRSNWRGDGRVLGDEPGMVGGRAGRRRRGRRPSGGRGAAPVHGSMSAEVIEVVPVEGHVDPAPRLVGRGRRLGDSRRRRGEEPPPGARAIGLQMASAGIVVHGATAPFVVAIEVAAVVVIVGRPATGRQGHADVVDRELLPVRDMADVFGERPVGATGVGWRGAGQVPGGIVQAGPRGREADPTAPASSSQRSRCGARKSTARTSASGARRRSATGGDRRLAAHRRAGPPVERGRLALGRSSTLASSWSPSSTVRR